MKPESRNKPQLLQVPSDSKFSIKTNVGFISDQERRLSQIVVFFVTLFGATPGVLLGLSFAFTMVSFNKLETKE